jgi:hypothetical protein
MVTSFWSTGIKSWVITDSGYNRFIANWTTSLRETISQIEFVACFMRSQVHKVGILDHVGNVWLNEVTHCTDAVIDFVDIVVQNLTVVLVTRGVLNPV